MSAPQPLPGGEELHAEMLGQAAFMMLRHGPEAVGPNISETLQFRGWPRASAEAYAARITAEAGSWKQDSRLVEAFRAHRKAQDERARQGGTFEHYVPGVELAPEQEHLRPLLEARLASEVAARVRSRWIDAEAAQRLAGLAAAAAAGDIPDQPGQMLPDFLAAAPEEPEFEIPGVVPVASRLIVTGDEGTGKSTFKRYMAARHAAGIHPFTGEPYEGGVSVVLDCENPVGLQQLRFAELAEHTETSGGQEAAARMSTRLIADAQPAGIDLAAAWWQEYVLRLVGTWKATFLAIGPLYKLCSLKPMSEEFFTTVSAFLDRLRTEHGCALAIEAHCRQLSPGQYLRDPFPYGNSGWRRWPDAGLYLTVGGVLSPWRPSRFGEDVAWPLRLERVPGSQVLWNAAYPGSEAAAGGGAGGKLAEIIAATAAEPGLSKRKLKAAAHDDGTGIAAAVAAGAIICHGATGPGKASRYFPNPEWAGGPAGNSAPPREPNWEWMAAAGDPSANEDEPW